MNRRLRRLRRRSLSRTGDRWHTLGAVTPAPSEPDWSGFEADLTQLETAVQGLRDRFDTVRTLQSRKQALTQQLQSPDLGTAEIIRLTQQLEALDIQLESSLFSWRSLQEPFWQAVRFGGLGIVLGWVLRWVASG